jgi:putative cell wall-binding protein
MKPLLLSIVLVLSTVAVCVASASAQKLTVTIVNRQDNETDYTYVVPGHFNSQSNSELQRG